MSSWCREPGGEIEYEAKQLGPGASTAGGCRPGVPEVEKFDAVDANPREEEVDERPLSGPLSACVHHAGISPGQTTVMPTVADEPLTSSGALLKQFPPGPPRFEHVERLQARPSVTVPGPEKDEGESFFHGKSVRQLGPFLLQHLMEVLPLRSQTKGGGNSALFPLPTSIDTLVALWPTIQQEVSQWILCVCVALNSLWGGLKFGNSVLSSRQQVCLELIRIEVERFCKLDLVVSGIDWQEYFTIRGIDYKGDEVKVARWVKWENVAPALPKEIGLVPLAEVCTLGCREYVVGLDSFLKPREAWGKIPRPKVMVEDGAWATMCTGLVRAGVCCLLEETEVFQTGSGPLLNGLFGVSKEDWTPQGVEVFRLIMNMIPFNSICQPLGGDIDTLPSWSMMSPFFLQPGENLLISSEDVKCFFYAMRVPDCWTKFLAFNKTVPSACLPPDMAGKVVYLASRVLPMGFLNSVSIAQNVHRNLVKWSYGLEERSALEISELRKDRPFTVSDPSWRVYLDNYDLLEKVTATGMVDHEGTVPEQVRALRQEYLVWSVPRNEKKAVERSARCELQGATVDGVLGLAFPKETKLAKYFSLTLKLLGQKVVSQRQLQVVCGGLVYFSMFRRPVLGALNAVWGFIEAFNTAGAGHRPLPAECRLELLRFLGLLPLIRMNFRLDMHPMVTCSDASTTGGGVCRSSGLTPVGSMVAQGGLRGQLPQPLPEHQVLLVGLFDGIGALRVAMDLQSVAICGYVSVESNPSARRVVESQYPGVVHYDTVEEIQDQDVKEWSLRFSQCSLVLLGAGPPCQGVSGLNSDRRGALKDARSSLFVHVSRIRDLLRAHFPWSGVHALMESVSSMDRCDRDIMSQDFGCDPVHIDAGSLTWCNRPRLYWTTWNLCKGSGAKVDTGVMPYSWTLEAIHPVDNYLEAGWSKVDLDQAFPTFTTSRPSPRPGRKPAGVAQCQEHELLRWRADWHRFPPYQYLDRHGVVDKRGNVRVPSVSEREVMLGFPLHYTSNCVSKGERKKENYMDVRLTLLGNTWSVPVVAWLVNQLLSQLGIALQLSPQAIVDRCAPGATESVQDRLIRLPLRKQETVGGGEHELAFKLGNLISLKGEDILLTTPTTQLVKFHRLRASVPAKLWKWRIVSGWKWTGGHEHINSLELRAILNALRWRLERQGHHGCRMLHLTDSLVCLHALTRGRTSSRKLRSSMARISALLLCTNSQCLWGYVRTDSNPADKPSRWGTRVRSRFKNA